MSQLPESVTPSSSSSPMPPPPSQSQSGSKADSKANSNRSDSSRAGFWQVFFSTFGAIFLAELGDKTQVATLLMSAESGNPWVVFWGAGTALVMTSLIGVALGQWLARKVSPRTLDTAAGAVLLAITVGLLWDVVNG